MKKKLLRVFLGKIILILALLQQLVAIKNSALFRAKKSAIVFSATGFNLLWQVPYCTAVPRIIVSILQNDVAAHSFDPLVQFCTIDDDFVVVSILVVGSKVTLKIWGLPLRGFSTFFSINKMDVITVRTPMRASSTAMILIRRDMTNFLWSASAVFGDAWEYNTFGK